MFVGTLIKDTWTINGGGGFGNGREVGRAGAGVGGEGRKLHLNNNKIKIFKNEKVYLFIF